MFLTLFFPGAAIGENRGMKMLSQLMIGSATVSVTTILFNAGGIIALFTELVL